MNFNASESSLTFRILRLSDDGFSCSDMIVPCQFSYRLQMVNTMVVTIITNYEPRPQSYAIWFVFEMLAHRVR